MEFKHSNISIFTKGDANRQSIIFVHGFPYDHHMWDKLTNALSEEYYCVMYDIRGLGESDPGDGQFTIEMFTEDLSLVTDKLNLNKPVLCALSMGGYISLRALERQEKKFKSVILCDTKSEADSNQNKLKRAQGVNIINQKGLEAFLHEFIPTCFAEESVKRLGAEYEEVFNRSKKNSPLGVKGCLIAMAGRTDTTDYLSKIEIPALILCGDQDKLSPPEVMEEMSSRIRNSEFHIVPGSGHMTPIEQPGFVAGRIKDFLKRNS